MNISTTLILELQKIKNNRGKLSELRRGLSEINRHAAWPALSSVGGQVGNIVDLTIAALFALHPEESNAKNLGSVWRELRLKMCGSLPIYDDKQTSFEIRFARLLACRTQEELCKHLRPFIFRAKSENIGINYFSLYEDVCKWGWPETKLKWAKEYWKKADEKQKNLIEAI